MRVDAASSDHADDAARHSASPRALTTSAVDATAELVEQRRPLGPPGHRLGRPPPVAGECGDHAGRYAVHRAGATERDRASAATEAAGSAVRTRREGLCPGHADTLASGARPRIGADPEPNPETAGGSRARRRSRSAAPSRATRSASSCTSGSRRGDAPQRASPPAAGPTATCPAATPSKPTMSPSSRRSTGRAPVRRGRPAARRARPPRRRSLQRPRSPVRRRGRAARAGRGSDSPCAVVVDARRHGLGAYG
jgi:hypothetical protein